MTSKTLSQHIAHTINRLTELQDEKALEALQEAFNEAILAAHWGTQYAKQVNDKDVDTAERQSNALTEMKALFRKVE